MNKNLRDLAARTHDKSVLGFGGRNILCFAEGGDLCTLIDNKSTWVVRKRVPILGMCVHKGELYLQSVDAVYPAKNEPVPIPRMSMMVSGLYSDGEKLHWLDSNRHVERTTGFRDEDKGTVHPDVYLCTVHDGKFIRVDYKDDKSTIFIDKNVGFFTTKDKIEAICSHDGDIYYSTERGIFSLYGMNQVSTYSVRKLHSHDGELYGVSKRSLQGMLRLNAKKDPNYLIMNFGDLKVTRDPLKTGDYIPLATVTSMATIPEDALVELK